MQDSGSVQAAQAEAPDLYIEISVNEPALSLSKSGEHSSSQIICRGCEIKYIYERDVFVFTESEIRKIEIHLRFVESDDEDCGVFVVRVDESDDAKFSAECILKVSPKTFDRVHLGSGARLALQLRPDEYDDTATVNRFKFSKNPIKIFSYNYRLGSEVAGGRLL